MDIRYLKAFYTTVRLGSFSGAAAHLNIAQSAVSRQIKLLEDSTGCELIIRSSKTVVLTPKGQRLYELAGRFFEESSRIFSSDLQQVVRIGIVEGLLESWFRKVIVTFYKTHSNNLEVTVGSFSELIDLLKKGMLDLIFTPDNIQTDLISSLKMFDEKQVLISKDPVELDELEHQRWITYGEEDLLFRLSKKQPKRYIKLNSLTSIVQLVKEGLGVAAVPEHILEPGDSLNVKSIPGHETTPIYLTCLNYTKLPTSIETIIKLVKDSRAPK
jgi:DNA-binding transcriptional LysR family regulator